MLVREVMTESVITIGPSHTLRDASRLMAEQRVGSVVCVDPDGQGCGIVTERDVVRAVAAGLDLDREDADAHLNGELAYASPQWTLEQATETMRRSGFRHLVVLDGNDVVGIISLRDIVKAWTPSEQHVGAAR